MIPLRSVQDIDYVSAPHSPEQPYPAYLPLLYEPFVPTIAHALPYHRQYSGDPFTHALLHMSTYFSISPYLPQVTHYPWSR